MKEQQDKTHKLIQKAMEAADCSKEQFLESYVGESEDIEQLEAQYPLLKSFGEVLYNLHEEIKEGKVAFTKGSYTKSQEKKIAKIMREYKDGKLKTSSGKKVTDKDQAMAIALSEAGVNKAGFNFSAFFDKYKDIASTCGHKQEDKQKQRQKAVLTIFRAYKKGEISENQLDSMRKQLQ